MHKCQFCYKSFTPRAQVKNPRACDKESCQKARQKTNEQEWRERNKGLYDSKYHHYKKEERIKRLKEKVNQLIQCIDIGHTLNNYNFDIKLIEEFLSSSLIKLGIRFVNKLCGGLTS